MRSNLTWLSGLLILALWAGTPGLRAQETVRQEPGGGTADTLEALRARLVLYPTAKPSADRNGRIALAGRFYSAQSRAQALVLARDVVPGIEDRTRVDPPDASIQWAVLRVRPADPSLPEAFAQWLRSRPSAEIPIRKFSFGSVPFPRLLADLTDRQAAVLVYGRTLRCPPGAVRRISQDRHFEKDLGFELRAWPCEIGAVRVEARAQAPREAGEGSWFVNFDLMIEDGTSLAVDGLLPLFAANAGRALWRLPTFQPFAGPGERADPETALVVIVSGECA